MDGRRFSYFIRLEPASRLRRGQGEVGEGSVRGSEVE